MGKKRLLWATGAFAALACSPAVPDREDSTALGGTGAAAGAAAGGVFGGGGPSRSSGGTTGSASGGALASGGLSSNGGASAGGSTGCVENLACTVAAPASTGDIYQDCVDRINQFRTECACLPALARWTDGESCANQMAEYDSTAPAAHAAFQAKICAGGSAQDECPGWRSTAQVVSGCLQRMWSEGPPPQTPCTGDCYQDHGHFINMTSTRTTKVACGFFTTPDGKVWSVQNFSR